jgi:hypothetical protein
LAAMFGRTAFFSTVEVVENPPMLS